MGIIKTKFWVDYNMKIMDVYPNFKQYAVKRLADYQAILSKHEANITVKTHVDNYYNLLKTEYLALKMDKEWDTFSDKEKQNKEDCENSRIDKFKEWIQKDWLAINTKKIDSKKTKIDKCKDDECKDQVQSKLDYYTNLMGSLTQMKEFFLL